MESLAKIIGGVVVTAHFVWRTQPVIFKKDCLLALELATLPCTSHGYSRQTPTLRVYPPDTLGLETSSDN